MRRQLNRRLLLSFLAAVTATSIASGQPRRPREIDWDELLPERERLLPFSPPLPLHEGYLDESGPAAQQTGSAAVNPKLNGQWVRLPGFLVPLSLSRAGMIRECLLVPYYGACIHVPPPPPNQIVYVVFNENKRIDTIFDAYWITGTLRVAKRSTNLAATAYTLEAVQLASYP